MISIPREADYENTHFRKKCSDLIASHCIKTTPERRLELFKVSAIWPDLLSPMNICYNCIINIKCIFGDIKIGFCNAFVTFLEKKLFVMFIEKNFFVVKDLHPQFPHFGKIQYLGHSKCYIFFTF